MIGFVRDHNHGDHFRHQLYDGWEEGEILREEHTADRYENQLNFMLRCRIHLIFQCVHNKGEWGEQKKKKRLVLAWNFPVE